MAQRSKTILIAAAGTSGHIRPGWILAQQAQARGYDVVWVGSEQDTWTSKDTWPRLNLALRGVRNHGIKRYVELPFMLIRAVMMLRAFMKKHRPDCVILMGGYVTIPVAFVAYIMDIPYVVFEQNTVLGFSQRMVLPCAHAAFSGLPLVRYTAKVRCIGNPMPLWSKKEKKRGDVLDILIFGGSLGSSYINQHIPRLISAMDFPCNIVHITGVKHLESTQSIYRELGLEAQCLSYVESLEDLYNACDVVIARSGAMTVSELLYMTKASILIPFAQAADNHQFHNAQWLYALDGACVVEENTQCTQYIKKILITLQEKNKLAKMEQSLMQFNNNFDEESFWHDIAQYIR